MISGWPTVNFNDCAEMVQEKVLPSTMGDALYIGLEHIGEGTLSLSGEGIASDVTSTKTKFRTGDILFGKLRPYFRKVVQAPREGVCSTDIWAVRAQDGVDQRYLYYCMASKDFVNFATAGAEGTRMPRATWDHVSRYAIPIPPLDEQRAIAHILGTLDEKIELNRRMNQTLEEMARAMYKDWFVDFGPTRAKLEGREPYLPPELWDLFPDHLVDSDLGEIPDGWEIKALSDYASLNPESWSKKNFPNDIEYVDLANTKWGTVESTQLHSWETAPSRARRVLRQGDTIVGTVRPGNGSYSLVGKNGLTGSTGFAVLRPQQHRFRDLVYLAATDPENIEWLAHRADGAAYPAVRPEVVAESQVVTPVERTDLLHCFSEMSGPLLDKIEGNQTERQSLMALRNELLPNLVSGQLRLESDLQNE